MPPNVLLPLRVPQLDTGFWSVRNRSNGRSDQNICLNAHPCSCGTPKTLHLCDQAMRRRSRFWCMYSLHMPLNRPECRLYTGRRRARRVDAHGLGGASAATLMPLVEAIRRHVFAAQRIPADDTTVPVLARGKTSTGRLWTYVRDDRPFAGPEPPAAAFFYSRDRGGEQLPLRWAAVHIEQCRRARAAHFAVGRRTWTRAPMKVAGALPPSTR
jgi:Transposase IS66 family